MDASGRIADEEIRVLLDGFFVGVETDGGRIGIWFPGDDGDVEAVAPALELLDGGSPEGVGGGEHDGVAAVFQPQAELCGGGRLAGAIHTDDEDDDWFAIGSWFRSGGVVG